MDETKLKEMWSDSFYSIRDIREEFGATMPPPSSWPHQRCCLCTFRNYSATSPRTSWEIADMPQRYSHNQAVVAGVHSSDLIGYLCEIGTPVTKRQLLYAASTGKIPRPFTTRSGDFSWRPEDAELAVAFFKAQRPTAVLRYPAQKRKKNKQPPPSTPKSSSDFDTIGDVAETIMGDS